MLTSILRVFAWCLLALPAFAQSPGEVREDAAVGDSINYVFAADLGSGLYELDGRTLQIYRFNWKRELREMRDDHMGIRAVVPVTAGFFDFNPIDVISSGPPTRIDSFSVVPGIELDIRLGGGWNLIAYARTGFSVASSSVDGWLYGAGFRLERNREVNGWDSHERSELAYAGVKYRHDEPGDQFLRLRQGFDFTRAVGKPFREHRPELGVYAVVDFIVDPPTLPLADARVTCRCRESSASPSRLVRASRSGASTRRAWDSATGWRVISRRGD